MIFQAVRYQASFWSGSIPLQADLVIPPGPGPHPAVVLVGGASGPRDRGQWVEALAHYGLATLSWDSPGWGVSPGLRAWQAPDQRTLEVVAAVEFLRGVQEISPNGVAVLGGDTGCWAATLATGLSSRVAALVLLAPPCTGAQTQELYRLGQRLQGRGFITAEMALAQLVLAERIRRLAAGQDGATVLAAEAPCRHAPWYGWLPGSSPAEVEAFGTLNRYHPVPLLSSVGCPVLGVLGTDDPGTPARDNATLLSQALAGPGDRGHQIMVLPRTDDAFAPPQTPGWSPRVPGDWHRDLVGMVAEWLAPRIGLGAYRSVQTFTDVPRAG